MKDILERLGGQANFYIAGSDCENTERADRIIASDCILAPWEPAVSHRWWSDVAYGATLGKPIISGTLGGFVEAPDIYGTDAFLLSRISQHRCFCGCLDLDDLKLLATAFFLHDKSRKSHPPYGRSYMIQNLKKVESPIEARLLVHLAWRITEDTCGDVKTQVNIGPYRVDFTIEAPIGVRSAGAVDVLRLVIEADGHDFHEKSKDQAVRDKKRDRTLTQEGWRVVRFTGSEIWNDPEACVQEVIEIMRAAGVEVLD